MKVVRYATEKVVNIFSIDINEVYLAQMNEFLHRNNPDLRPLTLDELCDIIAHHEKAERYNEPVNCVFWHHDDVLGAEVLTALNEDLWDNYCDTESGSGGYENYEDFVEDFDEIYV